MDWKRERDALIAQTYAFVQSVARNKGEAPGQTSKEAFREAARPEPRLPAVTPLQPPPEVRTVQVQVQVQAEPESVETVELPPPAPLPRPIVHSEVQSEVQDEIRARIASFRAHQERFNRERAEYFSVTLARLRAALEKVPPGRRANPPGTNPPDTNPPDTWRT
jgi:LmbE family N-acetylglucosaminyl deacetylase